MNRRHTQLGEIFPNVFHIDVQESDKTKSENSLIPGSSDGDDSLATESSNNLNFLRSHSLDINSLNNSGASRGNVRRWSQSLSKGAKNGKRTVRQKTINFMPSRMQGAFSTISVDGMVLLDHNIAVENLTQEIEQHDHLMEDNMFAEKLRLNTLRALPQSLAIKRQIKAKLSVSIINKSNRNQLSEIKKLRYKVGMWFNKLKTSTNNTIKNIEIWYGSMKKIEGHFGSGVGTYFKFLRWLFSLNLLLLVMTLGFIVIPQILFNNTNTDLASKLFFPKNNFSTETSSDILRDEAKFNFLDIFTAEGFLAHSVLFYGSYTNVTFSLVPSHAYSLPYAYFMTMICLYVATFIIVSISMARSYRKSFIETSGGIKNMYAHQIFCSWDFGISKKETAQIKHSSIYNELKEVLHDIYNLPSVPSSLHEHWTVLGQVTAHLLVFGMLTGLGFAMWSLLKIYGDNTTHSSFSALYVSLTVNVIIFVLQIIFTWIATIEDYKSARLALHITLMRNYLLEVVIVGVLLVFWLKRGYTSCWETSIGQEIYRLVVVEFILFGVGGAVVYCIRYIIYRWFWNKIGLPEFDISRGSLGLVFNQTLLWVGLLFAPPLAAIISIKMILTFYIKKATLFYFCKPPSKLWRSAQTSTLFLVMVFSSLLGLVVTHGYIITQVEVSKQCGPFRGHAFMFQIFIEGILKLKEGHWIWRVVIFFTKPAVIGGILLTMCVMVYYLRSKSQARIAMVKLLNEMLYLEAKDKEFLLSNITRVTQGKDWLFEDK